MRLNKFTFIIFICTKLKVKEITNTSEIKVHRKIGYDGVNVCLSTKP